MKSYNENGACVVICKKKINMFWNAALVIKYLLQCVS